MRIEAIVSTPHSGIYQVKFYSIAKGGEDDNNMMVTVPCRSYEHARIVANAYNAGDKGVAITA